MRRASADVFALRVDAGTVLTRLRAFALVHVRAVAAGTVQFVALVAFAAEHAENVLAATENAQVAEHLAFVDVHTSLLVVLVRMHETHLALASICSWIIQAVSVLAERVVLRTFVYVFAAVAVAPKTGVAHALKSAILTKCKTLF